MNENELSRVIIGAAIEVHRTLGGPGLLENVYEEALVWELTDQKIQVERQKALPIRYKATMLATPLRIGLVVGDKVIVECKSTIQYNPIFEAQTMTYVRLTGLRLGLVINFGEPVVGRAVHRVVNGL